MCEIAVYKREMINVCVQKREKEGKREGQIISTALDAPIVWELNFQYLFQFCKPNTYAE